MAFVSYEGEVIPFESKQKKPDSFAKDSGGFGLSSMEQLTKETGDDWWKLPLITAIGGAAAGVAFGAGKSAFDWAKGKISPPPPPPQIEPTLGIEPPTSSKARSLEDAQAMSKKALANRVAITPPGVTPDVPIFTPQTNVPPTVQAPTAPAAGTQSPMGAVPPQQIAPTLTEAVATGENATKAVQQEVAAMVDKAPATATKIPKEPVAPKTTLSVAPEQTPVGYYKGAVPPDVLARYPGMTGKGGNFVYNILGPEKTQDFFNKFHGGTAPADYKSALALWQKHGPEYLKDFGPLIPKEVRKERGIAYSQMGNYGAVGESGKATPGQLLNIAGNALGVLGNIQAYKQGKKTGDWSDLGLGVIGQLLGNLAPRAAGAFGLMAPGTLGANEQAELARRAAMPPTIDR